MQGSEFNQAQAVRQPQIGSSFQELCKANAELESVISKLIEKLQSVIRVEPELPPSGNLAQDTKYNTPMATEICHQKDMIENETRRIGRLISLLEI